MNMETLAGEEHAQLSFDFVILQQLPYMHCVTHQAVENTEDTNRNMWLTLTEQNGSCRDVTRIQVQISRGDHSTVWLVNNAEDTESQ